MTYLGGSDVNVLETPHVYLVWWGWGSAFPDGVEVPYLNAFARGIGGTPSLGTLDQYTTSATYFVNGYDIVKNFWRDDVNPLPQDPWDPNNYAIPDEAKRAAQYFGTESDPNALYVILVPHLQDASGNPILPSDYCGRHASTINANGYILPFIDMPYQPDTSCYSHVGSEETTDVFEHELAEAITDPFWDHSRPGWQDSTPGVYHCEVADKCQGQPDFSAPLPRFDIYSPTYFKEPELWSNEASSGSGGCVDTSANRVNLFARGSDTYLYEQFKYDGYRGSGWFELSNQPNGWVTDPGVTSWGNARIDLFVVGGAGNVRSGYSTTGGASMGWGNWGKPADTYPSYTVLSSPTVVSFKRYSLDVFVTGCQTGWGGSCHVFHKYYEHDPATNQTTYSSWTDIGAPTSGTFSGPGAVAGARGEHSLDVWIRDTVFGNLWRAYSDNRTGPWTWENWGTPFAFGSGTSLAGDPDGVSLAPGNYSVFIDGSDGSVYEGLGANLWMNYGLPQGHPANYSPAAVSMGTNRFRVFANANSNVYQYTYDYGYLGWNTVWAGYFPSGLAASSY